MGFRAENASPTTAHEFHRASEAEVEMPKVTTPTSARQARRHNPLEADILATGLLRQKSSKRKSKDRDEDDADGYVESKPSKKILQLGRELAEEDKAPRPNTQEPQGAFDFGSRFDQVDDHEDDDFDDAEDQWADEGEVVDELEIDANDLETFNKFLPDGQDQDPLLKYGWDRSADSSKEDTSTAGFNLADVILAKIAEHEATVERGPHMPPPDEHEFPPRVIEVYTRSVSPGLPALHRI